MKRDRMDHEAGEGPHEASPSLKKLSSADVQHSSGLSVRPVPNISNVASAAALGYCPICRGLLITKCARLRSRAACTVPCQRAAISRTQERRSTLTQSTPCCFAGIECVSQHGSYTGTPCSLVFGRCGCVFHGHCLAPWTMRSDTCPTHGTLWEPSTPRLCGALTGSDGECMLAPALGAPPAFAPAASPATWHAWYEER